MHLKNHGQHSNMHENRFKVQINHKWICIKRNSITHVSQKMHNLFCENFNKAHEKPCK